MTEPVIAHDALGLAVPVPAGVDAEVWIRFCERVVILPCLPHGCHLWTGPPRDDGYGQVHIRRGALPGRDLSGTMRAHRFAYQAVAGVLLEEAEQLLHQCDEPLCCVITREALLSGAHTRIGDNAQNAAEREARGRSTRRGKWGLPVPTRADRRGQAERSRAIHDALARALALDVDGRARNKDLDRADLAALVAAAAAAGQEPTLPIDLPAAVPIRLLPAPAEPPATAPRENDIDDQPTLFEDHPRGARP